MLRTQPHRFLRRCACRRLPLVGPAENASQWRGERDERLGARARNAAGVVDLLADTTFTVEFAPLLPRRGSIREDSKGMGRTRGPGGSAGKSNTWTKRRAVTPSCGLSLLRIRFPAPPPRDRGISAVPSFCGERDTPVPSGRRADWGRESGFRWSVSVGMSVWARSLHAGFQVGS